MYFKYNFNNKKPSTQNLYTINYLQSLHCKFRVAATMASKLRGSAAMRGLKSWVWLGRLLQLPAGWRVSQQSHTVFCWLHRPTLAGLALSCVSVSTGCLTRSPVAFPEPATVQEPGKIGGSLTTAAPVAPADRENTAAFVDHAEGTLLAMPVNIQTSLAIGVLRGCEAAPNLGPVLSHIELGLKCALFGNASHDRLALAVGLGARTYSLLGPFHNYLARTGLYMSYRTSGAFLMAGAHISYGDQMYFLEHGVDGEWRLPNASVFVGRETRLTAPIGVSPLATQKGLLLSIGVVPSFVLQSGLSQRVKTTDPALLTPVKINAPWEIALTFQLQWGRPPQDRAPREPQLAPTADHKRHRRFTPRSEDHLR
jgi:hypothetical protein